MDVLLVVAVWLHTVAFVIAWGYYGVLGRMILPGLGTALEPSTRTASLAAIERRALPLIVVSLVLFTVTGTYLLVTDDAYQGLGNVFASNWTTLMLVKHVVVIGLVVGGVLVDRWIRAAADAVTDDERTALLRRVTRGAEVVTGMGALIVLLTAVAQTGA